MQVQSERVGSNWGYFQILSRWLLKKDLSEIFAQVVNQKEVKTFSYTD